MNRRGKTKEGFLYVKQPSRFGKAWKRRWLVIRPNATSSTKGAEQGGSILLELYLEKGAYNKTVTSLLLEGVTSIRRVLSKSQPRAFEFMKGNTNVALTLAAESETDAQEWMEIFKKQLLPASEQKELTSIEGYGSDVTRLSVVPNKDSQRLKLSGVYLAGVSRLQVTLHHVVTGEKVLEWDLRHMKRFMLPSKGPQQDLEKIACLQISNRSPQGQGEYLFFSTKAKPFVEAIYERLSSAITVKERRSRTSSMLFEIPPKELEQLAKAIQEGGDPSFVMVGSDGSEEGNVFGDSVEITEEDGKEDTKTNGDVKPAANGDGSAETREVKESVVNGVSNEKSENGQKEEEVLQTNKVTVSTEGDATGNDADNSAEIATDKNEDSVTTEDEKVVDETTTDSKVETSDADISEENSKEDSKLDIKAESDSLSNGNDTSTTEKQNGQSNNTVPSPVETMDTSGDQDPGKHDIATEPIDGDNEEDELTGVVSEVTPRMPPTAQEIEKDTERPMESKSEDDNEKNYSTSKDGEPVSTEVNKENVGEATTASGNAEELDVSTVITELNKGEVINADEGNTKEQNEEAPIVSETGREKNAGLETPDPLQETPSSDVTSSNDGEPSHGSPDISPETPKLAVEGVSDISEPAQSATLTTESIEPEASQESAESEASPESAESEASPESAEPEALPESAKPESSPESAKPETTPESADPATTLEESSTVQPTNPSSQESQDTEQITPAASADFFPPGNTDEPSSAQSTNAVVKKESALTESNEEATPTPGAEDVAQGGVGVSEVEGQEDEFDEDTRL